MDALERYIHDFSSPEEELLHELDRQTHLQVVQPRMLSGHIHGKLLELLVRMLRPRNILEIGTFTGYSALCMAAGLEEGSVLDTVEVVELDLGLRARRTHRNDRAILGEPLEHVAAILHDRGHGAALTSVVSSVRNR